MEVLDLVTRVCVGLAAVLGTILAYRRQRAQFFAVYPVALRGWLRHLSIYNALLALAVGYSFVSGVHSERTTGLLWLLLLLCTLLNSVNMLLAVTPCPHQADDNG